MKKKGLYLVFEGIVGSGKTTQAKLLVENLKRDFPGKEVVFTYEPGGSEIADMIRFLVQGTRFKEEMDPVCESYLYAASRAQTLRRIVRPVVDRGGVVIADRNYISSVAYQGVGRGLGFGEVIKINKVATEQIEPDKVFFFDIDLAEGIKRARDLDGDKFERMDVKFYEKVRSGYMYARKKFAGRWVTIDASGSIDEVQMKVYSVVTKLLGRPQLFKK
jgi:dTMP kinase